MFSVLSKLIKSRTKIIVQSILYVERFVGNIFIPLNCKNHKKRRGQKHMKEASQAVNISESVIESE